MDKTNYSSINYEKHEVTVLHVYATCANLCFFGQSQYKVKITPHSKIFGLSQSDKLENLTDILEVGDCVIVFLNSTVLSGGFYTVNDVVKISKKARVRLTRTNGFGVIESFIKPLPGQIAERASVRMGSNSLTCDSRSVFLSNFDHWSKPIQHTLYVGCTVAVVMLDTAKARNKILVSVTPLTEIQDVKECYGKVRNITEQPIPSGYIIDCDTLNAEIFLSHTMFRSKEKEKHVLNSATLHFQMCATYPSIKQPFSAMYAHPASECSTYHRSKTNLWIDNITAITPTSPTRTTSIVKVSPLFGASSLRNFSGYGANQKFPDSPEKTTGGARTVRMKSEGSQSGATNSTVKMEPKSPVNRGLVRPMKNEPTTPSTNFESSFSSNIYLEQICEEIMTDDDSAERLPSDDKNNDPKGMLFGEMLNFIESFNQLALNDDQVWNIISEKDPLLLAKGLKIMNKNDEK